MATRPPGPRRFLTEEERNNKPEITKELIFRILSYLKPYRLQFIFVFIAIVASSIIGLWPSIITGRIVDEALTGQNLALLVRLLLLAFVTLVGSQFIITMESYINAWISHKIIYDMKNQMYRHLILMPQSFFLGEKQGDIITRMNSDIGGVSAIISGTLTSIVSHAIVVLTTLVAVFLMNWKLALVGVVVIPIIIIPSRQVGRTRWKLLSESQQKSDEMNQIINETLSISGSLLVKLFTKEEKEIEKFDQANQELTEIAMKEERSGRFFRVMMGLFAQIGPLLIYFAGGYMLIRQVDDALTVGVITSTVILINRLYRPIQMLLNVKVDFVRSVALFSRIFEYFDRPSDVKNPEDPQKPELKTTEVVFDEVRFSYRLGIDTVKEISFQVDDGSMVAIVGPSGSGKSTIINLIPRLYDVDEGAVRIGGVDVRDMDLTYLRNLVGFVSQDTYLFNGTIRENLLYAKEDATQEELEEACRIADLHEFIVNQPDGYNTLVGNRGLKLSGGEKQRVSIARVVLKDPKILVLDEATSSLDSISESSIQKSLELVMKHRTNIVIAHRLSTVLAADQIVVIDKGMLVEKGRHDELLAGGGIYKQLFDTQFEKVLEDASSYC
ncbi:ABC transporter ATP-binding protein [Alkalibacter rhizosphaerae]|uniref:ABC transporter ATP-binding protein n=1 Tax=Alkalibacter rhizosphaerae TaxID=2815577 RepID=A0A974XEV4_9FIRM|nr:ABC transporter ATP-binding protein [Alkalibacter rhizosphaerae]QSX08406.1 ABC transporter ATP-binding protein [Alkalibacter rhizosphaerae]